MIEAEKEPQDVDWITKEARSNGYLAPIVNQKAEVKHKDGEQVYSTSSGTQKFPNLLIHRAFFTKLPKESDMRTEYDEGLARSANRTNKGSHNGADLELFTNLAERSNNTGATSEKGASIATLSTGALFYISYGKNDNIYGENDEVEVMDLSDNKLNVDINEPPFEGGRLALGRKSYDNSAAVEATVALTTFVAAGVITFATAGTAAPAAWAYVSISLNRRRYGV